MNWRVSHLQVLFQGAVPQTKKQISEIIIITIIIMSVIAEVALEEIDVAL